MVRTTLVLGACLGLAACGGEDAASSAGATRAETVARGDAICRRYNAEARRLNARAREAVEGKRPRAALAAIAPVLREAVPPSRRTAAALGALRPPTERRALLRRYVASAEQQVVLLERLAEAAARGDARTFAVLTAEQGRLGREAARLTRRYGFEECGSPRARP